MFGRGFRFGVSFDVTKIRRVNYVQQSRTTLRNRRRTEQKDLTLIIWSHDVAKENFRAGHNAVIFARL
jgi:hypothetical protein